MVNKKRLFAGLFILAVGITGYTLSGTPSSSDKTVNQKAIPVSEQANTPHVQIVNDKGQAIGMAILKQEANGVRLQISVAHLTPGKHGIHIHETTFEDADFQDAGAHLNPFNKHHGLKNPKGFHLGDMPNLEVKPDGTAVSSFLIEGATLEKGKDNSLLGRSIIIHAKEDDQMSDPAGNSGERIAGGVILG